MNKYKKIIFVFILGPAIFLNVLFFQTNVLAIQRSTQFPKDPTPPIPVTAESYPSAQGIKPSNTFPSQNLETNNIAQPSPLPIEEPLQNTNENNSSAKKSSPLSLAVTSWMIFLGAILIVISAFIFLKFKKVV